MTVQLRSMLFAVPAVLVLCLNPAAAQTPSSSSAAARIVKPIDDTQRVTLRGNTHPATRTGKDLGAVDSDMPLSRMQLLLQRSPEQQAALDAFMAEQQDPNSPNFHHWLSPEQYGTMYGPSDADIATLTEWLRAQGFSVSSVSKGRLAIEFSGTAGQLQRAFHTELHHYMVNGEAHIANSSDPQIPEAIAPVVSGVLGLNDFRQKSRMAPSFPLERDPGTGRLRPAEPSGSVFLPRDTQSPGNYYVAPGDFATIYNTTPLLNSGINGAGVSIAIVARSNIRPSDIATYRTMFGLPDNPYTLVLNGKDPGFVSGDQGENTLDVEMAGMAAPGAKILLVVSGVYSGGTDGVTLSQLYIIDNQLAPIMSTSYGECELYFGTANNAFVNALTQQGSAEGISQFSSAGDSGAADCEDDNQYYHLATTGLQADGGAGTPYEVSVGGTDFADYPSSYSTYWSNTNSATGSSALKYIPEVPWNETCTAPLIYMAAGAANASTYCNTVYAMGGSNFTAETQIASVGGGGGVSRCTTSDGYTTASCSGGYTKPSWQTGPGVPADGKRDTPDVSLFAASGGLGNSVAFYMGSLQGTGGTSASSPAMAGLMALVVQKQGSAQGLPNPVFYKLAAAQNTANCNSSTVAAGNACVFYDVTSGNIEVPCQNSTQDCTNGTSIGVLSGYSAAVGYDVTTGLGSVNATNLVNTWSTQSGTPTIVVTLSPTTLPSGNMSAQYYQQITAGGGTIPYTYTLASGTLPAGLFLTPGGLLGGTPTTAGSSSFTITACDSTLVYGPACGSQAYSLSIGGTVANSGTITWVPGATFTYNGLPIGANVLNATTTNGGSISYKFQVYLTSTIGPNTGYNGTPIAGTILPPGQYLITATNSADQSTKTINFTVLQQHEWVINAAGNLTGLDAAGKPYVSNVSGGGLGIAVDGSGTVWSGNTTGTSLATFSNFGSLFQTGPSGGGLSAPSALTVDGAGSVWVANGNSSVSQFTNLGTPLSPTGGYTGGGLNAPTGIAVDQAGNVWVSNGGNNSITEIVGAATPVATICTPANGLCNSNLSPNYGLVATLTSVPGSIYTPAIATWISNRTYHIARDNIAANTMKVVYGNYYAPFAEHELTNGSTTYKVSVEYPSGTIAQCTFGGNPTITATAGQDATTDTCGPAIPTGAAFWIRSLITNTAGVFYEGLVYDAQAPGQVASSGTGTPNDCTAGGSCGGSTYYLYRPLAIIAPTIKPSVCGLGDSRMIGEDDTVSNSNADVGEVFRSIGPAMAYVNLAGGSGILYASNFTNRSRIFPYCSHLIDEYGFNDLLAGLTPSQIATSRANLAALFGKVTYGTTIPPSTSSTDNWSTLANQTTAVNTDALNAYIRAGIPGENGIFDIAAFLDPRDLQKWPVSANILATVGTAGYATYDGIHETTALNTLIWNSTVVNPSWFQR